MIFDHLGILVADLDAGRRHLSTLFGIADWTAVVEDPLNGVAVQFGRGPSGPCYELVTPFGEDSPVAAALRDGRRIIHHVAYRVADLDAAAATLRAEGCAPVGKARPALAFGHARIQFFVSPLKIVVELIEGRTPTGEDLMR